MREVDIESEEGQKLMAQIAGVRGREIEIESAMAEIDAELKDGETKDKD
ncbi:hypothetical protein [Microbulbifer epialgicus]|uniref:Uncharacterized protein n=1 Tax=Microbulbifer epialgicus TaxID=393907 RepID=A0ABV4NTS4_9GAMM